MALIGSAARTSGPPPIFFEFAVRARFFHRRSFLRIQIFADHSISSIGKRKHAVALTAEL
jgi:hypothetical protein